MKVKSCYLCNVAFAKPDKWNPDQTGVTERLHCSLLCNRMYRMAYASDATLRLEHSMRRAQDELDAGASGSRAIELRLRVANIKRSLKKIKKAQSRSPEPLRG